LPDEVIVTAMREHQKYFAARTAGKLAPAFIGVINGTPKDKQVVIRANEGVLKARLEDAKFFVAEDLKVPLETWAGKLSGITWMAGMGTMADKSERLAKSAKKLGALLKVPKDAVKAAEEGALLCKADLATNIIREKEFNSLQGVMGGLYAARQGKAAAGEAIRAHYYPRFAGDKLPPPGAPALLSITDKLDTLAGCFKARLIPTGSQDPFALRRQALGVLQILLENKFQVSLEDLVKAAQSVYGKVSPKETGEILDFFKTRLQSVLEGRNLSYDVVNAVIASGAPTLVDLVEKAEVVQRFKTDKDFQELATAAGRVLRILPEKRITAKLSAALLKEHEEKNLHNAVEEVGKAVEMSLEKRDYVDTRHNLQGLVKPIHSFFERIMVMDKNAKVRNNRLALLQMTAGVLLALCDFRKLVYASETAEKKPV
jgi:glycyl-tRNA synthetase beta chain